MSNGQVVPYQAEILLVFYLMMPIMFIVMLGTMLGKMAGIAVESGK